jgi:transcriptional regulator with XRE-family HTH domain
VAVKERVLSSGKRRGERLVREYGDAIRELRTGLGLSRRELVAALGISESKLARWERAEPPFPDLFEATLAMRVLGQDLAVKWYPAGGALRDVAHAKLTARFLRLIPPGTARRLEAPIPGTGDLRAWDVLLRLGPALVGVAIETRLRDLQALLRREQQKARDSHVDRLLLVLLNSHSNRRAVAEAGTLIREALPLDGRSIRPALREGRDPGGNGLIYL